jgi:hypothetical protein
MRELNDMYIWVLASGLTPALDPIDELRIEMFDVPGNFVVMLPLIISWLDQLNALVRSATP